VGERTDVLFLRTLNVAGWPIVDAMVTRRKRDEVN
jgi:hypothetical protein